MRMNGDPAAATSVPQSVVDQGAVDQGATAAPQSSAPPAAAPPVAPAAHQPSFWDKFAAIASTVGVNVLLFTPLAPIAAIVAAGIAEAQKIPGATGAEKLQHVAVIIQEGVLATNTQAGRQVLDPQLVSDTYVSAVNTAVAAIKLVHGATPAASQDVARAAVDSMVAKVLPGTAEALQAPPVTTRGPLASRTATSTSRTPSGFSS